MGYCEIIDLEGGEVQLRAFGEIIYTGLYDSKVVSAVEDALNAYMAHIGRITR